MITRGSIERIIEDFSDYYKLGWKVSKNAYNSYSVGVCELYKDTGWWFVEHLEETRQFDSIGRALVYIRACLNPEGSRQ